MNTEETKIWYEEHILELKKDTKDYQERIEDCKKDMEEALEILYLEIEEKKKPYLEKIERLMEYLEQCEETRELLETNYRNLKKREDWRKVFDDGEISQDRTYNEIHNYLDVEYPKTDAMEKSCTAYDLEYLHFQKKKLANGLTVIKLSDFDSMKYSNMVTVLVFEGLNVVGIHQTEKAQHRGDESQYTSYVNFTKTNGERQKDFLKNIGERKPQTLCPVKHILVTKMLRGRCLDYIQSLEAE